MKRQYLLITLLVLPAVSLYAQNEFPEQHQLEQKIESLASEGDVQLDLSEISDRFALLRRKPLRINTASLEDLQQSGLFSPGQIKSLVEHKKLSGGLVSIYELQGIRYFSASFCRSIAAYLSLDSTEINTIKVRQLIDEGHHLFLLRSAKFLPLSKAYSNGKNGRKYEGSPQPLYFRYRYTFSNRISVGLIGDKDAGEAFSFKNGRYGFDYISGHIYLSKCLLLDKIAIGDYQLTYGQGLLLWNGFSYGKSADVMGIVKLGMGIKPSLSAIESQKFRGLAFSKNLGSFKADIFASKTRLDGNLLYEDSAETISRSVSSIQQSGLHRTESELEDRHSVPFYLAGGALQYNDESTHLGITALQSSYGKTLVPGSQLYNQFYFSGKNYLGLAADYRYAYANALFFGEIASNPGLAIAQIHGLVAALDPKLSISFVYRNYPQKYQPLYAAALSERSQANNEKAFYTALEFLPLAKLRLDAYLDVFKFPWLSFGTDRPDQGEELMLRLTYTYAKNCEMYLSYRQKRKSANYTSIDKTQVREQSTQNIRLHIGCKLNQNISLRSRVEYTLLSMKDQISKGFLLYQDLVYTSGRGYGFAARLSIFDTDSYDSRLYAYENNVAYYTLIPAYYYKGSKLYISLRYRLMKSLDAWLHLASTFYDDRETIGSGNDEITGRQKYEVRAQLRYEIKPRNKF